MRREGSGEGGGGGGSGELTVGTDDLIYVFDDDLPLLPFLNDPITSF